MKRFSLVLMLIVLFALVAAACGGEEQSTTTVTAAETTTTTAEATTTTEAITTTTTAAPTTTLPAAPSPPAAESAVIELTGEQVVPPVDTDASGLLQLALEGEAIVYVLTVEDLDPAQVTSAGLYLGNAGQVGIQVVDLMALSSPVESGPGAAAPGVGEPGQSPPGTVSGEVIASGRITPDDFAAGGALEGLDIRALIFMFVASGQGVYVQVNTQEHPTGELRGQIDFSEIAAGSALPSSPPEGPGTNGAAATTLLAGGSGANTTTS